MNCTAQESAGKVVEDAASARKIGEALFFGAKTGGMRHKAATGTARGMLYVQHFVKEHVLDGDLRNAGMIHAAVE